jgi:hypothetical protein
MKTRLLLIVFLFPAVIFGQGGGQKGNYTPTSNTVYKSQTYTGSSQSSGSYQPKQSYQPTQQYTQPKTQQYQTVRQDNSQLQKGYSNEKRYQGSSSYSNSSTVSKQNETYRPVGLNSITKPEKDEKISKTGSVHKVEIERKPTASGEIQNVNTMQYAQKEEKSSAGTDVLVNYKIPEKEVYLPKSPELVYKLTPGLRLRYVVGDFHGWCDLHGFGVHAASFVNYNYCLTIAKWLSKKYHATSYILEDQSNYPHYHLVFGRWYKYISALIFEGKVRKEAPNAFVFRWTLNPKFMTEDWVLLPSY